MDGMMQCSVHLFGTTKFRFAPVSGVLGVVVSHPFAKYANEWGTEVLRLVNGVSSVVVSHPFAKNANGWARSFCAGPDSFIPAETCQG